MNSNIGILNSNRLGIPDELENPKGREEFSATCNFEKEKRNLFLGSYSVKSKFKGKKNILFLSSIRPMRKKTRDDQKEKPAIQKFYDFTKDVPDTVDQINDFYIKRAKTHKWTVLAFYYMLDTIRINAKTLWLLKQDKEPTKVNTFDVSFELANALVMTLIEKDVIFKSQY